MNSLTVSALARTLLLMRDDLQTAATDKQLLDALSSTVVVLVADEANLSSHASQSAFVTAAMLLARSAHAVYLVAPDVRLLEAQPPLCGDRIISALVGASDKLMPGVALSSGLPDSLPDLEVRFGDSPSRIQARRSIALSASAWSAVIADRVAKWPALDAPLGGLAAAALCSGEAFKASMMKLACYAVKREEFLARFAPSKGCVVTLAPPDLAMPRDVERFDVISGGAIANSFLYSLLRFRGARGLAQVTDFDTGDLTNLNRNVLMLHSDVGIPKVDFLAGRFSGPLMMKPVVGRFTASEKFKPLGRMVVGVDHVPTRWEAQACNPTWLGVGASSHWSAMASFHAARLACARCLHPEDDPDNAEIPTVAFVSFWSGLLVAAYFAQSLAGRNDARAQQTYFTPLRPEIVWQTPVARRMACPICGRNGSGGTRVGIPALRGVG